MGINLNYESIKKYLSDKFIELPYAKDYFFETAEEKKDFVLTANKEYEKLFSYKLFSIYNSNEDIKKIVNENFAVKHNFCKLELAIGTTHRISLIFILKDEVLREDIKALEECYSYDIIGEFPFVKASIILPLVYDKTKRKLYYKGNAIPWGGGSSFNYAYKIVNNIIKDLDV